MLGDKTNLVSSPFGSKQLGKCPGSASRPSVDRFASSLYYSQSENIASSAASVQDTDEEELQQVKTEHARIKLAERFDQIFGSVNDRAAYDASILKRNAPEQKIFGYPAEYLKQETGRLSEGFKKLKSQRDNLLRELLDSNARYEIAFEKTTSLVSKLHGEKLNLTKRLAEGEAKLRNEMIQSERAKQALAKEAEQVTRLEQACEDAKRALAVVERQCEEAEASEREAKRRFQEMEMSVLTQLKELEKLMADIEHQRMDNEESKKANEIELQEEIAKWTAKARALTAKIEHARQETEETKKQNEQDTADLFQLRGELHRKETQIDAMQERATAAEEKLNAKDGNINLALQALRETQDMNQLRIENLLKEKTRREARFEEIQQEKRSVSERLHEALAAVDRARDKEDQLTTRVLDLERSLVETHNKLNEAQASLDTARTEAAAKTTLFAEASTELEKTLERTTQEKEKLAETQKECADIKSRIALLTVDLNATRRTLDKLTGSPRKVDRVNEESREAEKLKRQMTEAEVYRQKAEKLQEELALTKRMLFEADTQRRSLLNEVQNLKGNIQVVVRIRPSLNYVSGMPLDEMNRISAGVDGMALSLDVCCDSKGELLPRPEYFGFSFNRVLDSEADQESVFNEMSSFAQSAMDGFNVCVFAYGQSKSGKTWTMTGDLSNPISWGIIPRSIQHVLNNLVQMNENGWTYEVECSYLEIYNETIRDLLALDPKLERNARHDVLNRGGGVVVTNVRRVAISDMDEAQALLEQASIIRSSLQVERANDNKSHVVFQLHLVGRNPEKAGAELMGCLSLCDLGGSEGLQSKPASPNTAAANGGGGATSGLVALQAVFTALDQKASSIPFRNSVLTHILSPCLSGEGKTMMIVNLSSDHEDAHETLKVLRFAQQVNKTELGKAKKNVRETLPNAPSLRGRNNSQ